MIQSAWSTLVAQAGRLECTGSVGMCGASKVPEFLQEFWRQVFRIVFEKGLKGLCMSPLHVTKQVARHFYVIPDNSPLDFFGNEHRDSVLPTK